jgi:hypothetical protein
MTREVLKLALETLEIIDNWLPTIGQRGLRDYEADTITAIKAALAQQDAEPHLQAVADFGQLQEQEPVAWMVYTQDGKSVYVTDNPTDIQEGQRALPLYTGKTT